MPLPRPPRPPFRAPGLSRSAPLRGGTSARLRTIRRTHEAEERPFDPDRRGSWRGSARDLVVNPGIYHETVAMKGDFVLNQHGTSKRWFIDLVQSHGTHIGVGHARGYATMEEATQEAQREARRRGLRSSVVLCREEDGDLRFIDQSDPREEPADLQPVFGRNGSIKIPELDDRRVLRNVWLATDPGAGEETPDAFDYECAGYRLLLWDTYEKMDSGRFGHYKLGYAFYEPDETEPLFCGEDFGHPSLGGRAVDSDETLRTLMGFLTLRPRDTDSDYFKDYTPEQLDFANTEAEELQWWGMECEPDEERDPCKYYVFVDVDPDSRYDAEGEPVRRGLKSHEGHKQNGASAAQLDSFTRAYLETALWSSNDESDDNGGEPLDTNYSIEDFTSDALSRAISDCARFQAEQANALASATVSHSGEYTDSELAGHDFWLTRNRHGAGFWDGDWSEPEATSLTEASEAFGEVLIYVGDDGRLHFGQG